LAEVHNANKNVFDDISLITFSNALLFAASDASLSFVYQGLELNRSDRKYEETNTFPKSCMTLIAT